MIIQKGFIELFKYFRLTMSAHTILNDIKQRRFKPIYLLHGEESYYIDLITESLEHTVLEDAHKGFDQTILYGKDVDLVQVISIAKRFPMMGDYQVVIIKEAQALKWREESDFLLKYIENLTPTTLLVIAFKHAKFDSRTKLYKAIEKKGLVFESKKLYDNKIGLWIIDELKSSGYKIQPNGAELLAEYLGNNLTKIANELQKLKLNVPKEREISLGDIEQNIGISKEFNVYELQGAVGRRDSLKALQIVDYFASNPKTNNIVRVISTLGGYFTKVLRYHYLKDKSPSQAAKELGVHPFYIKDYELAARNFSRRKLFDIFSILRDSDLKSKGVNVGLNTSDGNQMREMIYKILN